MLTAGDVDGAAFGEGGADAVGADDRLRGVEAGGEPHRVEAVAQLPVAAEPLDHAALSVAQRDRHAGIGERAGQVGQDGVGGVPEPFVQGDVPGVPDQQPVRLKTDGAAAFPGVEHRVPHVRLDH